VKKMVLFCPHCCNLLLSELDLDGLRFYCRTCPYIFHVEHRLSERTSLSKKKVDDILGGEQAWAHTDQTEAFCEKCGNRRAYFFQMQTRSADEPMTIFFRCSNSDCKHQWKEG